MIIADTREPEEIAKKCDKVALLEYGDYLIMDENNPDRRILVERKEDNN
jgi:ERCC4-type nuclease